MNLGLDTHTIRASRNINQVDISIFDGHDKKLHYKYDSLSVVLADLLNTTTKPHNIEDRTM